MIEKIVMILERYGETKFTIITVWLGGLTLIVLLLGAFVRGLNVITTFFLFTPLRNLTWGMVTFMTPDFETAAVFVFFAVSPLIMGGCLVAWILSKATAAINRQREDRKDPPTSL